MSQDEKAQRARTVTQFFKAKVTGRIRNTVSEGDHGKQATGTFSQGFIRPDMQKLKSDKLKFEVLIKLRRQPLLTSLHPQHGCAGVAGRGKMAGRDDTKPEESTAGRRECCSEELFMIRRETEEIHSLGVPGDLSQAWYCSKYFFNNYLHEQKICFLQLQMIPSREGLQVLWRMGWNFKTILTHQRNSLGKKKKNRLQFSRNKGKTCCLCKNS